MVQGCGNKCIKYVFWLLNTLFFILGAVIVGLSIWMLVDKSSIASLASSVRVDLSAVLNSQSGQSINLLLYVAIAIGGALFIIGFFGCCGSCCESICAISIYFILVLILFVVEIVAVVLYFVNKANLQTALVTAWRNELVSQYSANQQIRQALDQIQGGLNCCGASGCSDYVSIGAFPTSCQCSTVQQIGCATLFWNAFDSSFIYIAFVGIIVLFVELLAMIFSCIVISAVREKRNHA